MNWLRWYVGTCTDAKLHKASRKAGCRRCVVIAAWAALLEEARRGDGDGSLGIEPDAAWLAYQIDWPSTKCEAVLRGMRESGLIVENRIPAFSCRQFTSDDSTPRVRAHRAKSLKNLAAAPSGNVTVTDPVTAPEQNRTESESIRYRVAYTETPGGVDQPDLDALFYQRGKALLGKKAGGQLTKLRAACGSVGVALQIIDDAQRKDSPAEYIAGCIRAKGNGHGRQPARGGVVEALRRLQERDRIREEGAADLEDDGPHPRN